MPGDLRDPEQNTPWYYDPKYDATPNQFDPGSSSMDEYLQSVAVDAKGARMDQETLDGVKQKLDDSGMFHRNPGDESFRDEVRKLLMARRMATTWQIRTAPEKTTI